jgi:phospholipid N-methyltransferase
MLHPVDFSGKVNIVELGAGDGVITRHILDQMTADSQLFIFEVNDVFIEKLNQISDPRLKVIHDSAEFMEKYLKEANIDQVDYIISALPFVVLPDGLAEVIVQKAASMLKAGGTFVQIHYSLVLKKLYERIFGNVKIGFVLLNIPPAFILVSRKEQEAA